MEIKRINLIIGHHPPWAFYSLKHTHRYIVYHTHSFIYFVLAFSSCTFILKYKYTKTEHNFVKTFLTKRQRKQQLSLIIDHEGSLTGQVLGLHLNNHKFEISGPLEVYMIINIKTRGSN